MQSGGRHIIAAQASGSQRRCAAHPSQPCGINARHPLGIVAIVARWGSSEAKETLGAIQLRIPRHCEGQDHRLILHYRAFVLIAFDDVCCGEGKALKSIHQVTPSPLGAGERVSEL